MSRLVESIRLLDGAFGNLRYHQARLERSAKAVFGFASSIDLQAHLGTLNFPGQGLFKCRVIYSDTIEKVEWIPYTQKTVQRLKVVHDDDIVYAHKFEERSSLERVFSLRGDCEEIIIVKNGLVTDSSYSNLIFFDGRDWLTPEQPLLQGTMRQYLLDSGRIKPAQITADGMRGMKRCRLINAMTGFDGPELSASHIVF